MLRRVRFGLIDLLLFTTVIGVWFAAVRALWDSPTVGPMLLLVLPSLLMAWLLRFSLEDAQLRKERRKKRMAAPPPTSFEPATNSAPDVPSPKAVPIWRRLRAASKRFRGASVRVKIGGN